MAPVERESPYFINPPVVETILGVTFNPLAGWGIPHFGLFWSTIRQEYPTCSTQLPVLTIPVPEGQINPHDFVRCWYVSEDQVGLLQVQRDRFIRNWKKTPGAPGYPHYDATRPMFERDWVSFCGFLAQEGLGLPEVTQCEVSYVNHIGREAGDYVAVFPAWSGKTSMGLMPTPDAVNLAVRYPLPEENGQVSIIVQPAVRAIDKEPVYQMLVSVTGRPHSSALPDLMDCFDRSRSWARKAFRDFTSREMHARWGETESKP